LTKSYQNILSVLLVTLMLSGIIPTIVTPLALSNAQYSYFLPSDFTWQTFNRNMNVTTFVSPDGSRDELWHFLQSAEESIYVEIFGINNPYLLDLIHEIHDTKPSLEMKFLIGRSSIGYYSPNDYVANNLTLLGYPVRWTSDVFSYAHQKFVIIDNETTIVHSGNWAKTSFPEDGKKANREWSIAMTDTEVTAYYRSVFDYDWSEGTDYDADEDGTGDLLSYSEADSTYSRPFSEVGQFSGQMNVTPIFSPDTSLQGILYCINSAQATLDIQIPYFTNFGDEGDVDQIIDAIVAAKERGVTVRVISEEEYDWEEVAELFIEHDIPIVWQDTRWFTANHNKGIIVDGRIVLVSSINYSDNSISNNREAGVIIENEAVAQWYSQVYDYDWAIASCEELDEVNLYWDPNIPTSSADITVTVYTHELYPDVDEVKLGVKIGDGSWINHTITENVQESAEGDEEDYTHEIAAQVDGTNITVQAFVRVGTTWHRSLLMIIRVRDSIGSVITTTTTTTTPPDPFAEFIAAYGLLITIVVVAVIIVGGFLAKQFGFIGKKKRRKRKKK
jgi:phosphatidylserine/phosphatidylglycerophosphate/cardiolipin synthase-like enzyme